MQPPDNTTVRPNAFEPYTGDDRFSRPVSRRDVIGAAIAATGATAFGAVASAQEATDQPRPQPNSLRGSPIVYNMKKSINQWAFPYPQRMSLEECMVLARRAGFDGIELNYDLENDLSPKSGAAEYRAIRRMADAIGIQISGLCSFLFWPYPLTSNDLAKRTRGLELAGMIAQAAHDLGVENVLVVPGAVHIPWRTDHARS
jgi:L-ribulose-5-phosphate 3-epimerase